MKDSDKILRFIITNLYFGTALRQLNRAFFFLNVINHSRNKHVWETFLVHKLTLAHIYLHFIDIITSVCAVYHHYQCKAHTEAEN